MFKQCINFTSLTSEAANIFFQNITGDNYGSDCTFLATLRALVAPRLPEGESIRLTFGRSNYSAADVLTAPSESMVRAICSAFSPTNGRIYVHNLSSRDEESSTANIDLLKSRFCKIYDGWQLLDKISIFYQKSFRVICFINPDIKSVALFVDQLNMQKLHYLQMSTLAFLPWYFQAENGIEEIELEMLKSLRERSSDKYLCCIDEISKRYDFESGRIRSLLHDFETAYERRECENVLSEISAVDNNLRGLESRISDQIRHRNDLCIKLTGLKRRIAEGIESEIMEYFLCNRKLYLESVSNTHMHFAVRDYMSYFDEDAAQSYIDSDSGYFYDYCSGDEGDISKEGMKKLLNAIFIDQTLKIRFCAAYSFDLNGSVRAEGHHQFSDEFNGYEPNPHIQEYSCMGGYIVPINKALQNRDYITALEQCIASAKSLNLHDSSVMDRFVEQLTENHGREYKAIELPDGRVVSPAEAIKWIESQEACVTGSECLDANTCEETTTES